MYLTFYYYFCPLIGQIQKIGNKKYFRATISGNTANVLVRSIILQDVTHDYVIFMSYYF